MSISSTANQHQVMNLEDYASSQCCSDRSEMSSSIFKSKFDSGNNQPSYPFADKRKKWAIEAKK